MRTPVIKYGSNFAEPAGEETHKAQEAERCPSSPEGEHQLDDGRCLLCGLDLEYTPGVEP